MISNHCGIKRSIDFVPRAPSKSYLFNQVDCILSLNANRQGDYRNVSELFTTYDQILKNETSSNFKESLKESKGCIKALSGNNKVVYEPKLNALEKNNPNSFLIVPMVSTNHLFCAVVRKNDEGFSATLVNASKGGRRGDDRGSNAGYAEYIFDEKNLSQLLEAFNKTNMHSYFSRLTNGGIYEMFDKLADTKYSLNVVSRDQKDGNCYVKEPEKAIKYALATSDFSQKKLLGLRQSNTPAFRPKWPILTEEVHRRYIEQLKEENPNQSEALQKRFEKYLEYKYYVLENQNPKMPINGRSMEKGSNIEFQDNFANAKGTAVQSPNGKWTYKDDTDKVIGNSKTRGDRTEYFDIRNNPVGYSIKEGIGEKYYDNKGSMTGYSRFYHGMMPHTGEIGREQKGQHPFDKMIEISKTLSNSKIGQYSERFKVQGQMGRTF